MDIKDIPEELKQEIIDQFLSERGRQLAEIRKTKPGYKEKQARASRLGVMKRWGTKEVKVVLK